MDRACLGVTHSAKQGEWRGGFQGGTAHVEPRLILPAPEVIFAPLTKGHCLKCLFSPKKKPLKKWFLKLLVFL